MALKYLHPNVQVSINDLSDFPEVAVGGGTALYMPFFADRGRDTTITQWTSLSDFVKEYGTPSFRKHGQAIFNAINWLKNGGVVYGQRVVASDSYNSNFVLNVKTKADTTPVTKVDIKITVEKLCTSSAGVTQNVTDETTLLTLMKASAPTADAGFTKHLIFGGAVVGRGKYGNDYSFTLSLNNNYENTYAFRLYDLTIYNKDAFGNTVVAEGPFTGSFYPEAMSTSNTSLFLPQVLADYCTSCVFAFDEDAYAQMFIDMRTINSAATGAAMIPTTNDAIDFLFNTDKAGVAYVGSTIVTGTDLGAIGTPAFVSGADGGFDTASVAAATIATNKTAALVTAYNGTLDSTVSDRDYHRFDVVLDASFGATVQTEIIALVGLRGDCIAIFDTGVITTEALTVTWRGTNTVSDYRVAIFGQALTTTDPVTTKDMVVTPTYYLASKIPSNDNANGINSPFVGPNRGGISGFKTLNWNPTEAQKEVLYLARVNYIEMNRDGTTFATQNTSQLKSTALTAINNVRTLLQMVRLVRNLSKGYKMEYPSPMILSSFNSSAAGLMSGYVTSGACSKASAVMYQTAYDKAMKVARVKVDVVFNNIIERILIEFNVGR